MTQMGRAFDIRNNLFINILTINKIYTLLWYTLFIEYTTL